MPRAYVEEQRAGRARFSQIDPANPAINESFITAADDLAGLSKGEDIARKLALKVLSSLELLEMGLGKLSYIWTQSQATIMRKGHSQDGMQSVTFFGQGTVARGCRFMNYSNGRKLLKLGIPEALL